MYFNMARNASKDGWIYTFVGRGGRAGQIPTLIKVQAFNKSSTEWDSLRKR